MADMRDIGVTPRAPADGLLGRPPNLVATVAVYRDAFRTVLRFLAETISPAT